MDRKESHMKKIVSIIIAENANTMNDFNGNSRTTLDQPVLSFRSPFIPTALSFHIMIVMHGISVREGLKFGYFIENDSGEKIINQEVQNFPALGQEFDNFNLNIDVKNLQVLKPGILCIVANINNEEFRQKFAVNGDKILNYEQ